MTKTKQFIRQCPVCGAAHGTILRRILFAVFDDCPLSPEFDVVFCDACSFVFYDTPDTAEDFTLFYEHHYFVSDYTSKGDVAVMRAPNSPLEVMKDRLKSDARICDIGCGKGDLLLAFKQHGFTKLYGIDPSLRCVDYLRETHGLDVTLGTATNTVHQTASFDCILSTHTFEHILDLSEAAASLATLLAPGGLAYIEVPDLTRYDDFPGTSPGTYLFFEHINHFTPYALKELFGRAGLTLVDYGRKVLDEELEPSIPGCYVVVQKGDVKNTAPNVQELVPLSLQDAVNLFATETSSAITALEELAKKQSAVYVWGINFFMQRVLAMTPLKDCNIVALIDRDESKQAKTVNGRTISPPSAIDGAPADATVVVWRGPCGDSISRDLKTAGFTGRILVV